MYTRQSSRTGIIIGLAAVSLWCLARTAQAEDWFVSPSGSDRNPGTESKPFRSNGEKNEVSAVTDNVSWKPEFDDQRMEYKQVGLKDDFPAAYRP